MIASSSASDFLGTLPRLTNSKKSGEIGVGPRKPTPKAGNPARISVPVHGNASLKITLFKHLLKLSGISEDDL
jgi:hypothetical protein